jgi:GT2 family glycosyltransferase
MQLSVVIVNWKARECLPACIESLKADLDGIEAEIVFVDNASGDGSPGWVRENHPEVIVIENQTNLGFSRANNLAIKGSRGDLVMLLNPDTVVKEGGVRSLISLLEKEPAAGIAGPRIEYPDGSIYPQCKRKIPTVGDAFYYLFGIERLRSLVSRRSGYTLDHLDPGDVHEVEAISGSCMMIRREALTDIGLLDEDFFLYGEDLDLCLRAGRSGWKILYCPKAIIVHHHGQSSRQRRWSSTVEFYRAMRTFYRKHYGPLRHPFVNAMVEIGIHVKLAFSLVMIPLRPGRRAG